MSKDMRDIMMNRMQEKERLKALQAQQRQIEADKRLVKSTYGYVQIPTNPLWTLYKEIDTEIQLFCARLTDIKAFPRVTEELKAKIFTNTQKFFQESRIKMNDLSKVHQKN